MNVVYIYHIHIHSSVNGHLGHFHVLAIVNSAAMNIRVHVPYLIIVFFWNICPGVGLLDHMPALFYFVESPHWRFHTDESP